MIGHYLLTLTPDAEHDVLTSPMWPDQYLDTETGHRCLVGCAAGIRESAHGGTTADRPTFADHTSWCPGALRNEMILFVGKNVEWHYDRLCTRFGVERVNAAIRNRILANIARRTLMPQEATV